MKILIKAIYAASRYDKLKFIRYSKTFDNLEKIITNWYKLIPISYYYNKKIFWNIPSCLEKALCLNL